MVETKTYEEILQENRELSARLAEAEETLHAISSGEVDALVVSTMQGNKIFTLQGADQQYRLLIEQMQQGAVTISADRTILYCNRCFAETLGYSAEQIVSHQMEDYIVAEERESFKSFLEAASSEGGIYQEFTCLSQSHQAIPVYISAGSLKLTQPQLICLVVVDMSERKKAEESQAYLAAIVESSGDGIIGLSLDGDITSWNAGAERIMGYSAGEIIGKPIRILIPPDRQDEQTEILKIIGTEPLTKTYETVRLRKDGTEIFVSVTLSSVMGINGNQIGLSKIVHDITERKRAETMLQEAHALLERQVIERTAELYASKKQVEAILNNSPEGIVLLSPNLHIRQANPAFSRLFASQPDMYFDQPLFDLFPKLDATKILAVVQAVTSEALAQRVETHAQRADNTFFDAELSFGYVPNGGLVCIISDITSRKQIELALRASEQTTRRQLAEIEAIYNTAPVGLAVLGTDYRYLRINQRLAEINGLPAAAHLGHTLREVLPGMGDAREAFVNYIVQTGRPILNQEVQGETPAQPGKTRTWLENWYPLTDPMGRVIAVNVVVAEITEQKRSERYINLQQEITAALSSAATPKVIAQVIISRVQAAQDAHIGALFVQNKERTRLDLVFGNSLLGEFSPQDCEGDRDAALPQIEVLRSGQALWFETSQAILAAYPDHSEALLQNNLASAVYLPLSLNYEVLGVLSFGFPKPHPFDLREKEFFLSLAKHCAQALDRANLFEAEVTARLAAEEANQTKLKFLGMISHELRTPLTSIKGFVTTLLATDVTWEPENQQKFLAIIDEEADKLLELIEQLLDLSYLSSGRLSVTSEPLDLLAIIAAARPQLDELTPDHQLLIDVSPNLSLVVADKTRIAQVLGNLVGNAAKFAPPKTSIAISASQNGNEIQVNVSDQGPGIPPDDRVRIFEAFDQGLGSKVRHSKGAGLGLAICQGLIEAHGGKIWVADHPAPGTTISFTLPIVNNKG